MPDTPTYPHHLTADDAARVSELVNDLLQDAGEILAPLLSTLLDLIAA